MKKLFVILIVALFSVKCLAQTQLEGACGFTNTQNPCSELSPPILNPNTGEYGCFDWTVGLYRVAVLKTAATSNCLNSEVTHDEIRSPFYPQICNVTFPIPIDGQLNTKHFWLVDGEQMTGNAENRREDRDMYPSQGWVLLYESMGRWAYNSLNQPNKIYAVSYPSFVLYNKYTGITRVFLYDYCKPDGNNGVEISLVLRGEGTDRGSRIFDDLAPFSSALNSNRNIEIQSLNISNVVIDKGSWYVADFMTAYDPCRENTAFPPDLQVNFRRVSSYNVDLKVNGTIVTNQGTGSNKPVSTSLLSNIDYNGIGKASISAYKEFAGLNKTLNKYIEILSPVNKQKLEKSYDDIIKNQLDLDPTGMTFDEKSTLAIKHLGGRQKKDKDNLSRLLGISNSLPYLGTAYGLYRHFTSGTTAKKSSPTISTVNLTINGTIDNTTNNNVTTIRLPGASLLEGFGEPVYNKTLGLFRLLKAPKISYFNYKLNNIDGRFVDKIRQFNYDFAVKIENGVKISAAFSGGQNIELKHYNDYTLRQFYLHEPLKILVNESLQDLNDANIEVISSEAAFVLEYDKKYIHDLDKGNYLLPRGYFPILPYDQRRGKKFTEICNEYGWYVETATSNIEKRNSSSDYELLRVRTKYLPINIFDKQSFVLSWPNPQVEFFDGGVPNAQIKLVINYRPKDASYTGPNLLFVRSYEIDLEQATENGDFVGEFGFRLTTPSIHTFENINSLDYPREHLFKNTEIEKPTYNNLFPNHLLTPIRDESDVNELIANNPYQTYYDGNTLDFVGGGDSYFPNDQFHELSNRLLFYSGKYPYISPKRKNWNNVVFASTGELLNINTPFFSPDYEIPGTFTECSFNNPNKIVVENRFNNIPIRFSKCEFVASKGILFSGTINIESGSVIGTSSNPIFRTTPQYLLNGNIANNDEITDVCESQEYNDAVSNLFVKPSDSFFSKDSSNFRNRIQPIDYNIFPNPANNTVTIQAPKSETVISEIVLKNLLGMEVQRFVIKNLSSDVTIDVSTIPVGLYILNVNNFSTRLGIQR
jgi:hypothetical protein